MSDNETNELLPCPFCGGEATVERIGRSGYYYVACNTAYCCDFGKFDTEAEAIAAWNTRAELGGGTLTAEQVREAVLENFEETHETRYDHWEPSKFDWQAIADELNGILGSDDEYEAKMDALLCRLTNGKWSKSRAYSLDFMVSCVDEEYENAYEKERAELGSDAKPCYAADENYKRCKYSVNRGWCDDAPFLVWDDTGHLFITMGGLKTWDVTDDAKKWFAELGSGTCEMETSWEIRDELGIADAPEDTWGYRCSACGDSFRYVRGIKPNYCPECGRKVVSA